MKHLSYKLLKQVCPSKKGFDSDYYARWIGVEFMKHFGLTNISLTKGNNCVDVIGYLPDGTRCVVEIKERRMTSNRFNDHMCEADKWTRFNLFYNDGNSRAFILSVFENNTIALSNMKNVVKLEMKWCPRTTELGDNTMVLKLCNIYEQDNKILFLILQNEMGTLSVDFNMWSEYKSVELF